MTKSSFHKLIFFTLAVLVLVVVIRLLTVTPRTAESLHKLNQTLSDNKAKTPITASQDTSLPSALDERIKEITKDTLQSDAQASDAETKIAKIMAELQPHKYSQDPYIEARAVTYEIFACTDEFKKSLKMVPQLKKLTDTENFSQAQKQCPQARLRYPTLVAQEDGFSTLKNIDATTSVGKAIKQILPHQQQNQPQQYRDQILNRLTSILKSKIGTLVAEAGMMSFSYFQNGEILPFSQWLGSQDEEYNRQTTQFALTKLACRYQSGMACRTSSANMMIYCISDPGACGLSFEDYYAQSVMPGRQKDVELLVKKFEAMSQSK